MMKNMKMNEKFKKILVLVKWFDDARWKSKDNVMSGLLNLDGFNSLSDDQKILVHWLCYITDRMRTFESVWTVGGQIFSEIVKIYFKDDIRRPDDVMNLIFKRSDGYMTAPEGKAKIDPFFSKEKAGIRYAARYPDDLYSIARTLILLLDFDKSIEGFLNNYSDFYLNKNDAILKIAFLLYLLSYNDLQKDFPNFLDKTRLLEEVKFYKNKFDTDLNSKFIKWSRDDRYNAKRLWAALRDYLKKYSLLREHFIGTFEGKIRTFLNDLNPYYLEFPGDRWNKRFAENLLASEYKNKKSINGEKVFTSNGSRTMRKIFEHEDINENDSYYPEQFDFSFDFAPRMCDQNKCRICPFRKNGVDSICIKKVIHNINEENLKKTLCPVLLFSCGYELECEPEDCPIPKEENSNDLCSGCN